MIGGSIDILVLPLYMGWCIEAISDCEFDKVVPLVIQLFIFIGCSAVLHGLRNKKFRKISDAIGKKLRFDFYRSVIVQDIEFFEKHRTGDLISRMNSDID